jgi:N-acetylglucosamine kinase-like BadF-type ATPase
MVLGHDSVIALTSVTLGGPGVVVIGGTGSVGFGRAPDGREARCGGWGYVFGDEGSGYWIAVEALRACVRALDGTGPETSLLPPILEHFEARDIHDLHRRIYSGALARVDLASASHLVSEAARAGDAVSHLILDRAGRELGLLAGGVLRRLRWTTAHVEVGIVGGVFRAGKLVTGAFREAVHEVNANATVVPPRVPAEAAAALLALEQTGIHPKETVVRNLCTSTQPGGEVGHGPRPVPEP